MTAEAPSPPSIAFAILVAAALMARAPVREAPVLAVAAPTTDLGSVIDVITPATRMLGSWLASAVDRARARAEFAEYRALRLAQQGCSEQSDGRYECHRRRQLIRISKVCLDNPLAKDCM